MAAYEVQGNVLRGKEDTEANKSQGTSGIIGVTDMEKELFQNNVCRGYNVSYRPWLPQHLVISSLGSLILPPF